jgi:hypothetical protein
MVNHLKIPKGWLEAVNNRRTENTMVKHLKNNKGTNNELGLDCYYNKRNISMNICDTEIP